VAADEIATLEAGRKKRKQAKYLYAAGSTSAERLMLQLTTSAKDRASAATLAVIVRAPK
jgi:hypothetical protein